MTRERLKEEKTFIVSMRCRLLESSSNIFFIATLGAILTSCLSANQNIPETEVCRSLSSLHDYYYENRASIENWSQLRDQIEPLQSHYCRTGVQQADAGLTEELTIDSRALVRETVIAAEKAPPEYKTAVFQCMSDYQYCSSHLRLSMAASTAELSCGVSYVFCLASNLIPLAGR